MSDSVGPHRWQPTRLPVPRILQARTLEWVAISFSNAWKWSVRVKLLSRVRLFTTPWTAAYQAPPPLGFSRQEYWSGVPLPSPITLYTRQQKRHWCIEQSLGLYGRGKGWDDMGEWHWNMYNIIYEMSHQCRFDARYWMLGAGALGRPRGMVRGGRREEGSGWGAHVYLWRIHVDIWQNQYNIVKLNKQTNKQTNKIKELNYQCSRHKRHGFYPWVGKIPWRSVYILAWRIPWTEEPGGL